MLVSVIDNKIRSSNVNLADTVKYQQQKHHSNTALGTYIFIYLYTDMAFPRCDAIFGCSCSVSTVMFKDLTV